MEQCNKNNKLKNATRLEHFTNFIKSNSKTFPIKMTTNNNYIKLKLTNNFILLSQIIFPILERLSHFKVGNYVYTNPFLHKKKLIWYTV